MEVTTENVQLMKFSHGAGCGCKIAPSVLEQILKSGMQDFSSPNLLVGNQQKDDAAVYLLNENEAVISTTDFFTPIVNDPFIFGKVAAANAISDVYAMGGTPIMALAILGWPIEKLPVEIAQKVLEGAKMVCLEAGIPLAGGHSIDTPEPIFGLSVNGKMNPKHLKRNNTAKEGDFLLLTKPLGIGIFSTAEKRDLIEEKDRQQLFNILLKLNKIGEKLGEIDGVHAMTDITGFGLAGHLLEMAESSELTAEIEYSKVPKMKGIEKYLQKNCFPDATYRNWNSMGQQVKLEASVNVLEAFQLLPDPQTNGGLLISVAPSALEQVQQLLMAENYAQFITPIGHFIKKRTHAIVVK